MYLALKFLHIFLAIVAVGFTSSFPLMAVAIRTSGELEAGSPIVLFQPSAGLVDYDVATDGRFLVNLGKAGFNATKLNVVMNWEAGLK